MARGIDVPEVDLVINYEVPFKSEFGFFHADKANYLHRVGRTGRFGTDGVAVTLRVADDEVQEDLIADIAKHYGIEIKLLDDLQ